MPRPPGDPSFFDKTNYVIDSWSRPCDAPWYIYIEALWPAALEAFITLATFGWDDVARGYWRPRGLGRRTGKKRGKGRGRGLRGFPEIGEEIGKRIPTADMVKGRKWNSFGKTLWRIDLAMQRTLFWWLVADVTNDFAYNFTSILYETHWCQASSLGRFSYDGEVPRIIPGGGWWLARYDRKDYSFPEPSWFILEGATGSHSALIAATVQLDPVIGQGTPSEVSIAIRNRRTFEVYASVGPLPADPDGKATMIISGNVPPFSTFSVMIKHNASLAVMTDGIITGMENFT